MALIIGRFSGGNLRGTAGTDLIIGLGEAEFIAGREGNDFIFAGGGDDRIAGDNMPLPGEPVTPSSYGPFPPSFGGSPGNNLIFAGGGNDSVLAGFGEDTVFGGSGNDTLDGYGAFEDSPSGAAGVITADGGDRLYGGDGDDLIRGGGGNDLLKGEDGADTLIGGVGVDTLNGGEDADVFVFGRRLEPFSSAVEWPLDTGEGPGNRDIVQDFQQGEDLLDLSGYQNILARPGVPSEPVFLGTDPFFASFAPQIRYRIEGDTTIIEIFAPLGNPPPSLPPPVPSSPGIEIELAGAFHLTLDDIILT